MVKAGYIAGAWRAGTQIVNNINPSDLSASVGEFGWLTESDALDAVAAGLAAQEKWRSSSLDLRANILRDIGNRLVADSERIATTIASEEGKTLKDARGEVLRSAQIFHYFAGEVFRSVGESLTGLRDGMRVQVDREPVGLVLLVTPWNFPLVSPAWKCAAALAFGNSVILKPSEFTPATAMILAEIIAETELPKGVFNLINGDGQILVPPLLDKVDAISFTGSNIIGQKILQGAAGNLTKIQLELGGSNPFVVMDDADIDAAIAIAVDSAFYQTGQRCTAASRIFVENSIHAEFTDKFVQATKALRVGHALDANAQVGPVATERQLARLQTLVAESKENGTELLAGEEELYSAHDGYFFRPTVLANIPADSILRKEEAFGPLVTIDAFADLGEAIAEANSSPFGLSAGICTNNLKAAEHFRRNIRSGMVMINAPTAGVDYHAPFGGRGQSGFGGRENGSAAKDFYTELKTTYWN